MRCLFGVMCALALGAMPLVGCSDSEGAGGGDGVTGGVDRSGWFWQNPLPQGNALLGVSFTDTNRGTAVGKDGTIVRTTDGGATWVTQTSGTTSFLLGVSFTDANTGTAVGQNGTILRTTDGGGG
jgi:photosystem II stability/assembly factor-like uncharacterized protein